MPPKRLTAADELAVHRAFARGADIAAIEIDLGFTRDQVSEVVQAIGFQRARAAELVRQHEAAQAKRKTNTPPPPDPAPVRPVAAAKPAPGPNLIVEATTPEPQTPSSIENLLQRAEAIPRLRTRAARIRALLEDLSADVDDAVAKAGEISRAEKRVAQLRAQLEDASLALRDLTRPKAAGPPSTGEPSHADIRAWAAQHNIQCPATGRVPNTVRQQYNASRRAA